MWIAKKKFQNYEAGDEVIEEDAKRVGTLYCTKDNDANISIEVTIDKDEENKKTVSDTEDSLDDLNAGDLSKTAIDYESKTIPQLKEIADERKIQYANNILKADLIELLK